MNKKNNTVKKARDKKLKTELPASLIGAYEATDFKVFGPPPFTLRVGSFSPEISNIFREYGVRSAAFITAWNPLGELLDGAANSALQAELIKTANSRGLAALPGIGISADLTSNWQGEESLLVLGLDQVEASSLGAQFHQNAIVWVGSDAVPKLLLLR